MKGTAFLLNSRGTEIAISAWEPKLQRLLAENALVESCLQRKFLVIQKLRVTMFSVKDVNLETMIDALWWYETWQHCGYNHTHVKQKLLRRRRRACKSSWSRRGNQKSFTLTIPQSLANLVKIFPGIIVRQHRTDQKLMGLLREQCAEWKKVPLRYCCNQVWMKMVGWFHGMLHLSAKR